jgi:hypothetical protein
MSKKTAVCPAHKDNEKRTAAKLKRGFGKAAMKKEGMDHSQWAKKHDPLFKIKGKERHRRTHQI